MKGKEGKCKKVWKDEKTAKGIGQQLGCLVPGYTGKGAEIFTKVYRLPWTTLPLQNPQPTPDRDWM